MNHKTPSQIQRMLNISYSAFFFLTVFAILIASLIVNQMGHVLEPDRELFEILKYLSFISFLIHVPLAYILPQKAIKKIDRDAILEQKLVLYHKALFLRYAILASAVMFVSVIFCLTADTSLIYIAAMGLIFFLIGKPNPFKTASDLKLSDEDKQELFKS